MGFAEAFSYAQRRGGLRRDHARSRTRRPATTCAASATSGCVETPMQWPCAAGRRRDRNPIRYLNDGVSQTPVRREDGSVPRLAFPRRRPGGVLRRARTCRPPKCPTTTTRSCSTPVGCQHQWHTMTKTGKVAKLNKLNPGPFVEIHPDDAARLRHRATATRSRSPRAAAAPCCPPWSPTACGPATASRRSTGTTSSASTCRSTPSPTTRSTRSRCNRNSRCAPSR